jgi:hypothetical protein
LSMAVPAIALSASAMVPDSGFSNATFQNLAATDDGSTALIPFGFNINFFGIDYSGAYVNNNGNLTFQNPMSTYSPFGLGSTSAPIIAPFFGDVDTNQGNTVEYGTGTLAPSLPWFRRHSGSWAGRRGARRLGAPGRANARGRAVGQTRDGGVVLGMGGAWCAGVVLWWVPSGHRPEHGQSGTVRGCERRPVRRAGGRLDAGRVQPVFIPQRADPDGLRVGHLARGAVRAAGALPQARPRRRSSTGASRHGCAHPQNVSPSSIT